MVLDVQNSASTMISCIYMKLVSLFGISLQFVGDEVWENESNDAKTSRINE